MATKHIYNLRERFSIVGLTGRTGSGCTSFADIISNPIDYGNRDLLRWPEDIKYFKDLDENNTIFKRKYAICYKYFTKHNVPYKKISYLSVLLFYSIHHILFNENANTPEALIDYLTKLISENFKKSNEHRDDNYTNVTISRDELLALPVSYIAIIESFKKLKHRFRFIRDTEHYRDLYNCYFNSEFETFASYLFKLLAVKDFYLGSFFVHRLGNKIRATGDPFADGSMLKEIASPGYVFTLVVLINKIIKSWKSHSGIRECHFCIDSLRNSLEVMYLKERYTAFYTIAIHDEEEDRYRGRIRERIQSYRTSIPNSIENITSKVIQLDEIEQAGNDFKNGFFFAPDVENCIQKSDIHLVNNGVNPIVFDENKRRSSFYTLHEQWMKINSLILHPGLITPSHDERCMQVAFTAKLNSGCVSRQVGAVITNEQNSIRSIGWNDVPKGSIPCNLRNLDEIVNPSQIDILDKSYSPFETDTSGKTYKEGGNFSINTKEIFKHEIKLTKEEGLNHSFCFRSLHNKYEEKENQVHTRSLHAEENAMLQISKFGGQGLVHGTLYTTASPCELCAKKAYQLGLKIVYIDPYPGIALQHVLQNGYSTPSAKMFTGIIGRAYYKLFEPLIPFKDELALFIKDAVSH